MGVKTINLDAVLYLVAAKYRRITRLDDDGGIPYVL